MPWPLLSRRLDVFSHFGLFNSLRFSPVTKAKAQQICTVQMGIESTAYQTSALWLGKSYNWLSQTRPKTTLSKGQSANLSKVKHVIKSNNEKALCKLGDPNNQMGHKTKLLRKSMVTSHNLSVKERVELWNPNATTMTFPTSWASELWKAVFATTIGVETWGHFCSTVVTT